LITNYFSLAKTSEAKIIGNQHLKKLFTHEIFANFFHV